MISLGISALLGICGGISAFACMMQQPRKERIGIAAAVGIGELILLYAVFSENTTRMTIKSALILFPILFTLPPAVRFFRFCYLLKYGNRVRGNRTRINLFDRNARGCKVKYTVGNQIYTIINHPQLAEQEEPQVFYQKEYPRFCCTKPMHQQAGKLLLLSLPFSAAAGIVAAIL